MGEQISEKQIKALKYLIYKSKDAGDQTKKACFALIDESLGLTRSVYYTGQSNDISSGVKNMSNDNNPTHINVIMFLLETNFFFSHHGGHFQEGKFQPSGKGHTIWLSLNALDDQAKEITKEQVDRIILIDPLHGKKTP